MRSARVALTVAALLCVSCSNVSLTLRGERVRVTKHIGDAAGCTYLGQVEAHPTYAIHEPDYPFRNQAGEMGGDVVVIRYEGVTAYGRVYDCGGRYSKK